MPETTETVNETTVEAPAKTTKKAAKKAPAKKKTKKKAAPNVAAMVRAAVKKNMGIEAEAENLKGVDVVSSGSLLVDNLIGGTLAADGKSSICPGYPRRYMVEVYGPESSGKTTLALEAMASAQREGGVAVYLDFEHCLQHGYAKKVGVSFSKDKLVIYRPTTLEAGVKIIWICVQLGVDLIVVDSVSAMIPAESKDKKVDANERLGAQARQMSRFLPHIQQWLSKATSNKRGGTALIWINQERATISAQAKGTEKNTSGGRALKFYAAARLRTCSVGQEVVERKDPVTRKKRRFPYGNKTLVKVIKNKLDGRQGQDALIFIRYGHGIDEAFSVITTATAHNIIKRNGAMYVYGSAKLKGREAMRAYLEENPTIFKKVREQVAEAIRADDLALAAEDPSQEDLITEGVEDLNEMMGGDTVLDEEPANFDPSNFNPEDVSEDDMGEVDFEEDEDESDESED